MDCIPKASELCAHVWSGYTAFVKKGQKGYSLLAPCLGIQAKWPRHMVTYVKVSCFCFLV